mmetsp:Transcript_37462/g.57368  ORF Transcript_37462/g.57368 Transcript_37462/m.57368 type:complete len:98 (+) Transcript_37462:352-645(+)
MEIESLIDQIAQENQDLKQAAEQAKLNETLERQRNLLLSFLPIEDDFLLDAFVLYDEVELAPVESNKVLVSHSPELGSMSIRSEEAKRKGGKKVLNR